MRVNRTITLTAGTPVQVLGGYTTGAAVAGAFPHPVYASRIHFQLRQGSAGLGFVMMGIYGVDNAGNPRVPSIANPGDVTRVLSLPLAGGQPGGDWFDAALSFAGDSGADIDLRVIWVDGSTGDKIIVSWEQVQ